jgi:hypothetical protein
MSLLPCQVETARKTAPVLDWQEKAAFPMSRSARPLRTIWLANDPLCVLLIKMTIMIKRSQP